MKRVNRKPCVVAGRSTWKKWKEGRRKDSERTTKKNKAKLRWDIEATGRNEKRSTQQEKKREEGNGRSRRKLSEITWETRQEGERLMDCWFSNVLWKPGLVAHRRAGAEKHCTVRRRCVWNGCPLWTRAPVCFFHCARPLSKKNPGEHTDPGPKEGRTKSASTNTPSLLLSINVR